MSSDDSVCNSEAEEGEERCRWSQRDNRQKEKIPDKKIAVALYWIGRFSSVAGLKVLSKKVF